MRKNIPWGALSFFTCVLILFSAEVILSHGPSKDSFDLSRVTFWKLQKHTSLFGPPVRSGEMTLFHTGTPFNEVVAIPKPAGVKRIITIGTSSTEGYGVPKECNYPSLLQRLFDKQLGPGKIEVVNGAVGGYVSYQLLIYFKQILLLASPDVVILYLGHNDSSYHNTFTAREYYHKILLARQRYKNDPRVLGNIARFGLAGANPLYALLARSHLFGYLFCRFQPGAIGAFGKDFECPAQDQEYVLREFARICKEKGIILLFAPEAVRSVYDSLVYKYRLIMLRVAKECGITVVDVLAKLRQYPQDAVFLDFVHLTPAGNEIVAKTLFEAMQSLGVPP